MTGKPRGIRKPTPWQDRIKRYFSMGEPDECWLWKGGVSARGYARIRTAGLNSPRLMVHRAVYEMLVGPIPEGLTLDHLCMTPSCVNPHHVEPVPSGVNSRRSPRTVQGRNVRKTHCVRGHEFTEANTYQRPSGGRACRRCIAIYPGNQYANRKRRRT